ncbi:CARDB domain-containing protein [Halorubrum lipolyticum]|uniref:APHP domain-containing protein n=1 Tax=Halorubrum lipolyticum DSM 21995 TaxID=1227482 RepID=M0P0M9_9EURY|nr:CARDB domain-containing protein [Halorubrum lipolyticum]EMA63074.1 APHP domain-containing protein [Halorubrum lipolyticum DSM 21995]
MGADLAEETIVEGEDAEVTATVENVGNETGTFTAELEEGSTVLNTKDVEVGPGETRDIEFTEPFDTAGTYDLSVNGESAGTLTVEPPSAAFEVTDVSLSETEIAVGDTVTVTAAIENTGDSDGTYTADLLVDGTVEESKSVDIAAGQTETVTFTRSFDTAGDYTIGVGDGPTRELTVEPEPANVSVTDAELSPTRIDPGETTTVTATVVNDGGSAGEFTADLTVDGTTEESETGTLGADEKTTVEFTPSFEEAGAYDIAVNAESAGTLTVSEPASFEVSNAQLADDTILAGDDAVVSADVTNVGEAEGTFTAEFRATGPDGTTQTIDTRSVTLAGGESQSVELSGAVDQAGDYDVQVNETDAGTLTVESPANVSVTDAELEDDVVSVDDEVAVNATVVNTGDREGSLSVTLAADGTDKDTEEVTLGPGEQDTVRLTYTATAAGEYAITVNGVAAETLTVVRPATFRTTNAGVEPDTVVEGESVEATATVVNVGTESGTHTATLVVDDESVATRELEIGPGDSETVVFSETFETADEYAIAVNDEPAGTLSVLEPANVSIRDATLSSEQITVGESAAVTVELANDGDVDGEFTTQLQDDNGTLETDTRTVGSDASETVSFNRTFERGEYNLSVNGDPVGTLAVLEPADVSLGETTVSPESVEVDESIDLSVELRNDGEATGQRDVDIALGDGTTYQRTPDVPAGGTTLTISHAYNATGEYTVVVDDSTVANVSVVEPQNNGGSGGGGGPSGSSGSSGPSGGAAPDDDEPTVVRSESSEAVTVRVEGASSERYDIPVELAGPSDSQPAVSVSSAALDPAGELDAFETTVGRPAAEPDGRDPVPRGVALGYMEFNSTLGAANTSAATLEFTVDEESIPQGLGPEDVAVFRYADGAWTTDNVTHDVDGDAHTVSLPHASPVAIVALEPGRVDVVDGAVPADRVQAGYETTLRATVENPGDRTANRTLTVTMGEETVAEREVLLEPGANTTVQIRFEPPESGAVSLEGSEVGSIDVFSDGDDGATSPDSETDEDIPGFGAVAAVLALLVTALMVRIRR